MRFPGGLATADVPALLPAVVVYLPDHNRRNLPDTVSFATARGGVGGDPYYATAGVVTLVTDLAVIDLSTDMARLLTAHPWATSHEIVENTGFRLALGRHVSVTSPPSDEERAVLAAVDPHRRRDLEIKDRVRGKNSEVSA